MLDSGQRFEDLDLMHFALEKLDGTPRRWNADAYSVSVDARGELRAGLSKAPDWWQTVTTGRYGLISNCCLHFDVCKTLRGQSEGLLRRDSQFTNRTGESWRVWHWDALGIAESPRRRYLQLAASCLPPGNGETPLKPKVSTCNWGGGSSLWNLCCQSGETYGTHWDTF